MEGLSLGGPFFFVVGREAAGSGDAVIESLQATVLLRSKGSRNLKIAQNFNFQDPLDCHNNPIANMAGSGYGIRSY